MATYAQLVQFGPYFSGGLLCTLKVYHYIVGTTTLKDVYIDREKGSTAAQPVVSDANGIVSFYADGLYKFRIDGSTDGSTYSTLYTYDKWAVGDFGSQVGEGAALTAASTLVLGTDGDFFHVTGSTGITAISGNQSRVTLVFDSTPALTNSGNLILQQGLNYTAVANDTFVFINDGAGVWREVSRNSSTTGIPSQDSGVINGSMEVWQRGTAFAAAVTGQYGPDRFKWTQVGAGVVTLNRSTTVPTVVQADVLFNYSLEVDVTTADASLAATDLYTVSQAIEGSNWRAFAQRQINISFWVSSSKTGTHSLALTNSGTDRSYVAEYTVIAADTWEYKTVLVSASPSAGTWDYTNGAGVTLIWGLAAGSNFTTSSVNAWNSNALKISTNQVNVMDSTANFFRITGVKIERGIVGSPIQYRSFQEELALCKRYYQKSFSYATTPAQNAGVTLGEAYWIAGKAGANDNFIPVRFMPDMRTIPSVTTFNPLATNAEVRDRTAPGDCSATTANDISANGLRITETGNASTAVGNLLAVHWTASAEL